MKPPAELARRIRAMILAAQHHYSPSGEPMRSIVVSPDWIDDLADAAHLIDKQAKREALETLASIDQQILTP